MRLGIDFGTTRTVVAYADRGNYPVISFLNESGDAIDWYPSVIAERNGELRYGFSALQAAADPSWTVLRSFKRLLADPLVGPNAEISVGSSPIAIGDLLAGYLATLRRDLLTRSNLPESVKRQPALRAVVATPANAHSTQRFLTLDSFKRAGFEVAALLNEPSAAGFEYAHRHRSTLSARREHVVVYDLGGGTFDASLVRMNGLVHDVVATAGIGRLGGDDFDTRFVELVLSAAHVLAADFTVHELDQLTDHCRQLKESIHPNSRRIVVDLDAVLGIHAPCPEVVIATSDFYDACSPLVDRTLDAMTPIMVGFDKSDETEDDDAGSGEIAGVYVVGGASALPLVARTLRKHLGRRVHRSAYPSAATAIGLAIAGDDQAGFELVDRFSRTFGVFRESMEGAKVMVDPIFTREMRLPTNPKQPFVSCRLYRPAHNIGHFRYIECTSLDDDGSPLGDITPFAEVMFPFDQSLRHGDIDLRTVPVQRTLDEGPLVQERYSVDANGIVELTLTDLDTGYERVHRLCG